jgi:drug/metabolite transporter (DMT)-like permease
MMTTVASSKKINWAYLFLGLTQVAVSINIVSTKNLLLTMSPVEVLFVRFCVATLFLSLLHLFSKKPTISVCKSLNKKDWWHLILQALCAGTFFNGFLYLGLVFTSASVVGILTSALPAYVVTLSIIFLGARLTLPMAVCVILAIVGLLVMNAHSVHFGHATQWLGDCFILIALVPEAFYYILTKRFPIKMPILLLAAMTNAINATVLLVALIIYHHISFSGIGLHQVLLLLLIGICSAMFYVFWFLGHHGVHGVVIGLSTAVVPLVTLLLAWLFLHETISWLQMLGMFIVIMSIVIHACYKPKSRQ